MHRHAQGGDGVGQGEGRHDAQGRECPGLQVLPVNTRRFRWVLLGEASETTACFKGVGVWGVGRGWAYQRGLFLGGVVCGGDDSAWWIPEPVGGPEWKRKHNAVDRRREANNPGFSSFGAVTTTPESVNAGESAGRNRRGRKGP